jgi:hypothetical protein
MDADPDRTGELGLRQADEGPQRRDVLAGLEAALLEPPPGARESRARTARR